jgi:hypothetical protein
MKFATKRAEINEGLLEILAELAGNARGLGLFLTKLVTHIIVVAIMKRVQRMGSGRGVVQWDRWEE